MCQRTGCVPSRSRPRRQACIASYGTSHTAAKPDAKPEELPISAIEHDTPAEQGEWVAPGVYTVKLTAGGRTYTQKLVVKADPRE